MGLRGRICIFATTDGPGDAKARLTGATGEPASPGSAWALLEDAVATVQSLGWAQPVVAAPGPIEVPAGVDLWLQEEGAPGERIERILRKALADAPFAIAISACAPALPARLLAEARETLVQTEAVVGPALSGGISLLGLRRCPPGLLSGLTWGPPEAFARSRERLEEHGLFPRILDTWLDTAWPEDLEPPRAARAHSPEVRVRALGGVR